MSDFLNVKEANLKSVALDSFDPQLKRVQYSFLANEILLRIFNDKENPKKIKKQFEEILY